MTTTEFRSTPADEARRGHDAALSALRAAVLRSAELWRRTDAHAPVPGLTWTAAETAAHVVGDLRDETDVHAGGARTHVVAGTGSPSKRSAAVNAQHLVMVRERDMRRLADMLEEQAARYLDVARAADDTSEITIANGLTMTTPILTRVLLGEQLLHGLDVARAAHEPWSISRVDALLVVPAIMALTPHYLHPARSANVNVSYELRFRGGGRYRLAVRDGTADITAAGEKADCVITADPVAFLQLGYGRIPQWRPIIGGKMTAGGRKPWLAIKFGTLISSP